MEKKVTATIIGHTGPENLKKSGAKKTREIKLNFFLAKFHFLKFQKWPKINFWTGKSLKLAKMQFHDFFYLIFMENIEKFFCEIDLSYFIEFFLPGLFYIFWPTVHHGTLPKPAYTDPPLAGHNTLIIVSFYTTKFMHYFFWQVSEDVSNKRHQHNDSNHFSTVCLQ